MEARELGRDEARRIAVKAQLLAADRPTDLLSVVRQLTLLQLDPTAAIAPSADLVAWSRLGDGYRPDHLTAALEQDRTLYEDRAIIRPMSDLGLYLADMAEWTEHAHPRPRDWLQANGSFRLFVLDLLRDQGPLLSRDIPDHSQVPWPSTGWTNHRNVTQMLEILSARGEIAVSGRVGRQRVWDLAGRVHAPDTVPLPRLAAHRIRAEKRLRALGLARTAVVGYVGEPATVDGTRGVWRLDPEAVVDQPLGAFVGRTALLSPFDRLIHDRVRTQELFDFEYVLEMYAPKVNRRWGYFALPVLHGDRLIGKVDATAHRKAGVLQVDAIHQDVPFPADTMVALRSELAALADWIGLAEVRFAG